MELFASSKAFLMIFAAFGQLPWLKMDHGVDRTPKHQRILSNLAAILCTTVNVAMSLYICYAYTMSPFGKKVSWSEANIISVVATSNIAKCLAIGMQSIFFGHHIVDELRNLYDIKEKFRSKMNIFVPYQTFVKRFTLKCSWVCGMYVISIAFNIYRWLTITRWRIVIGILVKIMQLSHIIFMLHTVFHLDLLVFHLYKLNKTIERNRRFPNRWLTVDCSPRKLKNRQMRKQLKFYKLIYWNLCEAMQSVSNYFGWSIVTAVMHNFIEFVYCVYWLAQMIQKDGSLIGILRKWIVFFHHK